MKRWLALLSCAAVCAAAIVWGIIWDNDIKPGNTIPEPPEQRYSHDPHYIIHMPKSDTSGFETQVLHLGARLGWLTREGGIHSEVLATIPEEDLSEIERMTREPRAWLLEAMGREPAREVKPGPLINVGIDLDGFHGRSLRPFIPIGFGIAGLVAVLIAAIIIIAVQAEKRRP